MPRQRTAGSAALRGRPLHLPEDPSPATASQVRFGPRVGWLLASNRVLGPEPGLARREAFLVRLAENGVVVDAPRLSRLEAGLVPAPPHLLDAYEQALGLTPAALTATVAGVQRVFGPAPAARPRGGRGALRGTDLDELLETASGGRETGAGWLRVSAGLQHFDHVFLRRRDWDLLCGRLVRELATATGLGRVRRSEAAAALLQHPTAGHHLLAALRDFVTEPAAQSVDAALDLLAVATAPEVGELVLSLLLDPAQHVRSAASSVAAAKLARGHFDGRALTALEEHVEHELLRGVGLDESLAPLDLAVQLPGTSWARVEARLGDAPRRGLVTRSRATHELVVPRRAAEVASEVASTVQQATPAHHRLEADLMLRRLVREALVHVHEPRRHHAALLLAASPYAPALATACRAMTHDSEHVLAARAWAVLGRLAPAGSETERGRGSVLDVPEAHRPRAVVGVGLGDVPLSEADARALVGALSRSRPAARHATLFALGMHRSPLLASLTGHRVGFVRAGASWWLRQGGATRDTDVVVPPALP
jgi:hypothetical protein